MLNKIPDKNYTGMYDYYNTPIADGDIIEVHRDDSYKNHTAEVIYNPSVASWGYYIDDLELFEPLSTWGSPLQGTKTITVRRGDMDLLESHLIGLVVVGNIWHNPEDLQREPGFSTVLKVLQIH